MGGHVGEISEICEFVRRETLEERLDKFTRKRSARLSYVHRDVATNRGGLHCHWRWLW
jgi:hypothetical protein